MEDGKIIELFFARSDLAIVRLSEKYGSTCKRIAVNILGDEFDAEECVNDAYLGAWNTIPPEKPNPLLTYICRIVRNLSIKRYHRNTAQKRNSYYDASLDELESCIPSPESADGEINAKELASVIDAFLGGLDKENRVMFVRRYWFSNSISDIAALFKMSKHAVTVRLLRTRERLRQYLEERGVTV